MPKQMLSRTTLLYKNRPSNGAITLRKTIPSLRLLKNPQVINLGLLRKYKQVLNWGTTEQRLAPLPNILNKPSAVALAVNKIKAFTTLKEAGCNVPEFWTKKEDVKRGKDSIIFARTVLTGSGGEGIVPVRPDGQLPNAPLYVSYIRKDAEYRLHVFKEKVIFSQQKLIKAGVDRTPDQMLIRSHANGYVFAENSVKFATDEAKNQVEAQALAATKALGLDFGAVDLIVSKKDGTVYVLEVNTAPGLESTALIAAYKNALEGG